MRTRILIVVSLLLAGTPAFGNDFGPLTGEWQAQVKCEGLGGPAYGMPGQQVKGSFDWKLLIAQDLASKALHVLAFDGEDDVLSDPLAAWCGWANPSNVEMTKGQGSLAPYLFLYPPFPISFLFASPGGFPFGDSTQHIKKWEIGAPDENGCDAKLEMTGAYFIPGAGAGPQPPGSIAMISCQVKAKRCPSINEPKKFCYGVT